VEQDFTTGNLRRLSDSDFDVAEDDIDIRGWRVVDADGTDLGKVDDLIVDTDARKVRYLELDDTIYSDGTGMAYADITAAEIDNAEQRVILRSGRGGLLRNQSIGNTSNLGTASRRATSPDNVDSTRTTGAMYDDTRSSRDRHADGEARLTRAEEEVRIGKRSVEAGEVRVGKHIETEHRHEDVTVMREQVRVERRPVTDQRTAEIRASAEEIRVPIVEEEVVIEKYPVVREELVISKEQVQETRPVDVEVRREEFDIEDGRTRRGSDEDRRDPRRDKGVR
jgi:uncharacterized protein (TIGR02271 family)